MTSRSFLVLAANTPWVYEFALTLAKDHHVTAVRLYDWLNYRRLKPKWPEMKSNVRRIMLTLPPGYAGHLEPAFGPLLRFLINREIGNLRRASSDSPIVICPYPYLAPWVRGIPGHRLVYYNLDDYTLYDPARADRIRCLEDALITQARLTLCLSAHQVAALRARHPAYADRIVHFPLAVVDDFLNRTPEKAPLQGTIGYVGNLTNRVDWALVVSVAERMSDVVFHFVGSLETQATGCDVDNAWEQQRRYAFNLPNVIYEGVVSQERVREHYWRYAVNWMPYDVRHPFNIASCPTKIMDALASGRPFVSTDIPEVRLYQDHVHTAGDRIAMESILRSLLNGEIATDVREQVLFATTQTWCHRAQQLLGLLDDVELGPGRAMGGFSPPLVVGKDAST